MLFTALLGPYMVDWTAHRGTFEREASAYVGRPVIVAGKINVRLLPTPVLSFTDIRIGDEGAPDLEIERFRAEVELAPLLKGDVRIIQMMVERPLLRLDIADFGDGKFDPAGEGWRVDPERISLARLELVDGTAFVTDTRAGRSWQANQINGVVEAGSLRGPGRIDAEFVLDGEPLSVEAGLGRAGADNSVATKISIASPRYPVTLSTDGTLLLAEGEAPKYTGSAIVAGVPPDESEAARSPWADFRAEGTFELTPEAVSVTDAQLSYSAMERPLVLAGSGRLDLGGEPRFDVTISARQIDVDSALGGGAEQPIAVEAGFSALLGMLPDLPPAPLPGVLHLDAQGVVIGGSVIQEVAADLRTAVEGWQVESFTSLLPGETRVDLDGMLRMAEAPAFQGHGRVTSAQPAALAAWWRGAAGSAGVIGGFAIAADLDLGPDGQHLTNIEATTGEGTIRGSAEIRRFEQSGENFVNVSLSADRADLVKARALAELIAGEKIVSGGIDQMTLSLSADVLSAGGIEARSVLLDGGLEGGQLQLRRLSVADLAGASIEARGDIQDPFGTPAGRLELSLAADDITGAAEFLGKIMPGNAAIAQLRSVAADLSPLQADISAEAGAADIPLSIEVTGSFADTHVTVSAAGQGSLRNPNSLSGAVKLHVDSEDSTKVLAQLGLAPLPIRAGPLRIDADFQGLPASAGTLKIDGTIAGIDVNYVAETAYQDGELGLVGRIEAAGADIDPALLLAGLAVPGLGEGHAASVAGPLEIAGRSLRLSLQEASFGGQKVGGSLQADFGQALKLSGTLDLQNVSLPFLAGVAAGTEPGFEAGAWSETAFAAAIPPDLGLDFKLKAAALDLGLAGAAGNAELDFRLADGALAIDLAKADFGGGTLKGAIAGTVRDGEADLALRGTLQGGQLQALVWERSGLPVASGLMDASFETTGRGRSMGGLISTLAGSGSFTIGNGRLNALNPQALTAVIDLANREEEPDDQAARETFASHFGSGALPFGRVAGSLSIAAGVVNVATVSLSAGETTVLADAALDLNTLMLASDWSVRTGEAGAAEESQPYVQIFFSGPLSDPERQVDLEPLLDLVRGRYLQRQLDELEELEEARRQAETRRAPVAPPGLSPLTGPPPAPPETPPQAQAGEPDPSPALQLVAPEDSAAEAPGLGLVEQIEPAVEDLLTGSAGEADAASPAAAESPAAAPPEPEPAPPPEPDPPPRRIAPTPAPAPAVDRGSAPVAPNPETDAYRTLPNGVVVKIR